MREFLGAASVVQKGLQQAGSQERVKGMREEEGEDDAKAKRSAEVRFPRTEALYLKGISSSGYIIEHGSSSVGVFVRYREYKLRTSIIR